MTEAQTSTLPAPAPRPSIETQEFWDATADGRLLLRKCNACGHLIWYPRFICPDCHSTDTSWVEASGRGTIYTYTIIHQGRGPYRNSAPFVVAYVELAEGPRILTNIVDCPVDEVTVGMPVTVVFHDTGEGTALYRFRPAT